MKTVYKYDEKGQLRPVLARVVIGHERLLSNKSSISSRAIVICNKHYNVPGTLVHRLGKLYKCCPMCITEECKTTTAVQVHSKPLTMAEHPDSY